MESILSFEILKNPVGSYLVVVAVILLAFFCKKSFSSLIIKLFRWFAFSDQSEQITRYFDKVINTFGHFLFILVIIFSLDELKVPPCFYFKLLGIPVHSFFKSLEVIVGVTYFFFFGCALSNFFSEKFKNSFTHSEDKSRDQLVLFFRDFFKIILLLLCLLLILKLAFNQNIGMLLTSLSIVGAAFALAAKESLENLLACFTIFFDKSFTMGDFVHVKDYSGSVEKIGLRSTRIRTENGTCISVPNKQMVESIVENVTQSNERRVFFPIELSMETTQDQIHTFITRLKDLLIANQTPLLRLRVYFGKTGSASHVIQVEFYVSTAQSFDAFLLIRQQVNLQIVQLMEEMKIKPAALCSRTIPC